MPFELNVLHVIEKLACELVAAACHAQLGHLSTVAVCGNVDYVLDHSRYLCKMGRFLVHLPFQTLYHYLDPHFQGKALLLAGIAPSQTYVEGVEVVRRLKLKFVVLSVCRDMVKREYVYPYFGLLFLVQPWGRGGGQSLLHVANPSKCYHASGFGLFGNEFVSVRSVQPCELVIFLKGHDDVYVIILWDETLVPHCSG